MSNFTGCKCRPLVCTARYCFGPIAYVTGEPFNGVPTLYIALLNRFRRDNPALHELSNLRFLDCPDPNLLAYAKATADRRNIVIAIVNLDPHGLHAGDIDLPLDAWGIAEDQVFSLEEAFTGRRIEWRGARQRLALDPQQNPAVLFRLVVADL